MERCLRVAGESPPSHDEAHLVDANDRTVIDDVLYHSPEAVSSVRRQLMALGFWPATSDGDSRSAASVATPPPGRSSGEAAHRPQTSAATGSEGNLPLQESLAQPPLPAAHGWLGAPPSHPAATPPSLAASGLGAWPLELGSLSPPESDCSFSESGSSSQRGSSSGASNRCFGSGGSGSGRSGGNSAGGRAAEPPGPLCGLQSLPPNAVVWVEGETAPISVNQVTPGQRVLCFDSESKSTRHAEVLDVHEKSETVDWVEVELSDGTVAGLPADHPVQLAGSLGPPQTVKACDLIPQSSCMMVHRIIPSVPLRVGRVTRLRAPTLRDSFVLAVKHPDKNAILMASPPPDHELPESVGTSRPSRPRSWPPSADGLRREALPGVVAGVGPDGLSWLHRDAAAAAVVHGDATGSCTDSSKDISSCDSASSGGEAVVLLPWTLPNATRPKPAPTDGSLGALIRARNNSWPSVGSSGHRYGECKPCSFAYENKCVAGMFCSKCHGQHPKCNGKVLPIHPKMRARRPGEHSSPSAQPSRPSASRHENGRGLIAYQ